MEKIAQKMKSMRYESLDDFVSDFVLMFDNCCKYNEPDSEIYKVSWTKVDTAFVRFAAACWGLIFRCRLRCCCKGSSCRRSCSCVRTMTPSRTSPGLCRTCSYPCSRPSTTTRTRKAAATLIQWRSCKSMMTSTARSECSALVANSLATLIPIVERNRQCCLPTRPQALLIFRCCSGFEPCRWTWWSSDWTADCTAG